MGRAIFEPVPVDEEFCILLDILPDEPYSHEKDCERRFNRFRRRPNHVELFEHYRSIMMDKSIRSVPLPENMDQDTWMRFLRRMADAWKTYCLQWQTYGTLMNVVFGLPYALLFLSLFFMDISHDKAPPPWWFISIWAVLVPIVLILQRMKKLLEAPTKEYRKSQERVVKYMQLVFKCSGYSAEFVVVQCCGVTSRYIRFTPISESETDRTKVLVKDFQDAYKLRKDKAKNKAYYPAYCQPLEGQWEEKNRFGLGKVTHRWIFKRTASADTFHSQYECNFHTIACAFMPSKKLSYHLEGNLLLSDDVTPSLPSEIFRLGGNDYSVAFYRLGCSQIWKVEGSTCMQYKLEGRILSEDDIISTSFWSTQEPIANYHEVIEWLPSESSSSSGEIISLVFWLSHFLFLLPHSDEVS